MKHLLFIDIVKPEQEVRLPFSLLGGNITGGRILHWNIEGLPESEGRYVDKHFYIQLKFTGGLESTSLTGGGNPNMIQLPGRSFNGWGISPHPIPINLVPHNYAPGFKVEVFGEGECPNKIVVPEEAVFRLVLWIELEIERVVENF